jgi:hypothetical protein
MRLVSPFTNSAFTADAGDSVFLKGTTLAKLEAHAEDFHFV